MHIHYGLPALGVPGVPGAVSICTWLLEYPFRLLFQTRKKIEFKINSIFFPFRNWFLFSSFWTRVYFGVLCSTIYLLSMLQSGKIYQVLTWRIHYSHFSDSTRWNLVKTHLSPLWYDYFVITLNWQNWFLN